MKEAVFGLALGLVLVLALPAAFAQNTAEGQIYSMSVTPEEPIVFDQVTMAVGTINPSDQPQGYRLEIIITKDGEIKSSQPFTFTLQPGLGTFVSPVFVADDIGEYEAVAKLTDQFGTEVRDLKVQKFLVVSEIGPFDIAIDAPSDVITPGTRTPLILTLANMGEKATDVQVRVVLECNAEPDIAQEFFVFLFPGAVQDKQIATGTCRETGPHDITASVIVFNKTWITAVSQIFLNESFIELAFELPEVIILRAGEPKIFDVKVTNEGNTPINNLRLLMPKIPPEWVSITPSAIVQTEPHQTVLFLVNITPPRDALSDDTTLGISAAADQVLRRKETRLQVISLEGAAPGGAQVSKPGEALPGINLSNLIGGNGLYIGIGAVAAVGGLIAAMRFRRARPTYHDKREREATAESGDKMKMVAETLRKRRK